MLKSGDGHGLTYELCFVLNQVSSLDHEPWFKRLYGLWSAKKLTQFWEQLVWFMVQSRHAGTHEPFKAMTVQYNWIQKLNVFNLGMLWQQGASQLRSQCRSFWVSFWFMPALQHVASEFRRHFNALSAHFQLLLLCDTIELKRHQNAFQAHSCQKAQRELRRNLNAFSDHLQELPQVKDIAPPLKASNKPWTGSVNWKVNSGLWYLMNFKPLQTTLFSFMSFPTQDCSHYSRDLKKKEMQGCYICGDNSKNTNATF